MVRRWFPILALWLIGVLAAAQLAKIASIAPLLRERFELSLPQTGWLISLLEVGGGLFGFVAGTAWAIVVILAHRLLLRIQYQRAAQSTT